MCDVTLSQFVFPSGVRAHIFVSWLHPFKEQRLVVVGSEKMAVFDDTAEHKLVLYPHKVEWKTACRLPSRQKPRTVPLEKQEPLEGGMPAFPGLRRSRAGTVDRRARKACEC